MWSVTISVIWNRGERLRRNDSDLVVDFYHYLIKRRHYTSASRLLKRKIDRDKPKMGRRRRSWFLILLKNGEIDGGETVSRINSRLPADSIDGRFPGTPGDDDRDVSLSVTGAKNEYE